MGKMNFRKTKKDAPRSQIRLWKFLAARSVRHGGGGGVSAFFFFVFFFAPSSKSMTV
jgi:hypothetical protein